MMIKKLTQIKHFRHRRVVKFLIPLTLGLIVCILVALRLDIIPGRAPIKPYRTSWIGNTFGGGSEWVQNFIEGMYVATDGTVYTASIWDEGGREAGIYKDGKVIGMLSELHGWGRLGGVAITANSEYIFVAMSQGNEGET